MRKFFLVLPLFFLLLSCGGKKVEADIPASSLDEPDRALFERSKRDLQKNKFTVARLTLQTLINTYQDSEYLQQAKYLLAETFYKENTGGALNQAELEFKDFITFFPASDLADDAQLKVAMTHVRRMEKADRDRTQALLAEAELRSMVENYPDSQLLEEAKEKLRAVQQVVAEGVYKTGNFYFLKKNYVAAVSRYQEVLKKYPDFSSAPDAVFNIAEAYRRADNRESGIYYTRLVSEYPLSEHVEEAKRRLKELNMPVPEPNPVALARAQEARDEDRGIMRKILGPFSRRPPVSTDTGAAGASTSGEEESGAPADNKDGGFTIDPKVVQPAKQPAPKPR